MGDHIFHANLVGNPKYADICFLVQGDLIAAHSFIVEVRCPDLLKKNVDVKRKGKLTTYEILSQTTPPQSPTATTSNKSAVSTITSSKVLHHMLHYLYTGTLVGTEITPSNVIRLLQAADEYKLDHLVKETQKKIIKIISKKNIYDMWSTIEEIGIDLSLIVNIRHYININYEELVSKKGKESLKNFKKPSPEDIKVSSQTFEKILSENNNLTKDDDWENHFKQVLKKSKNCDFKIISNQQTPQSCHKSILSGHSYEMALLVEKIPNAEFFSTLTPSSIQSLLSWLYYGSIGGNDPNIALQLLPFANTLKLSHLIPICEKILCKSINHNSVFIILEVTMDLSDGGTGSDVGSVAGDPSKVSKLANTCLKYIIKNFSTLDLSPLREMSAPVALEVTKALQLSIGKYWLLTDDTTTDHNQSLNGNANLGKNTTPSTPPQHNTPPLPQRANQTPEDKNSPGDQIQSTNQTNFNNQATNNDSSSTEDSDSSMDPFEGSEDESESFHLSKYITAPEKVHNQPVKLQKKKRKKLQNIKDLDDLFE
eukprot:TRINITY_DN749_c0_g3_i1.p1 TRINITY_DN749_c0_g3~~TRINITY_DN749_c0_g3_i1.p1  ORF type:complete len:539 (-),score=112.58 TRINITY_DN749_c0_g3_i1:186-1802(-)